ENVIARINSFTLKSTQYRVGEIELHNGKVYYFFSMCGIGFDAHIVEKLHQKRKKKLYLWSYLTATFEELLIRGYRPDKFRIFLDTKRLDNVFFAIIFNINAYGGPFHFAHKKGSYRDDFLELIKFENAGKGSIPYIYAKALFNNFELAKDFPTVSFIEVFIEPEISTDKIPVHIDGDPLDYLPVAIRKSEKSIVIYS
ncbi:MAG: diacylglycerol/lipid kinase family protein, partial [Planctomycetota bacterium]